MTMEEVTQRSVNRTPSPADTVLKKCRICFGAERVPKRCPPPKAVPGKTVRRRSILDRCWGMIHDAQQYGRRERTPDPDPDPDDDGFVAPCRCSGSMAWVHRSCIRVWRNRSPRRDSFYRCEQCFTAYRFKETRLATIITHMITTRLLTLLLFLLSSCVAYQIALLFVPINIVINVPGGVEQQGSRIHGRWSPIDAGRPGKWTVPTRDDFDQRPIVITPTTGPREAVLTPKRPVKPNATVGSLSPTPTGAPPKLRRRQTILSTHSTISYLNIGFWISGHSLDDGEDARNDFLSAMTDLSQIKLFAISVIFLAIFGLLREGSQLSCVMASTMIICFVLWYAGHLPIFLWMLPVPVVIGMARFIIDLSSDVEAFTDLFAKRMASDLENYSEPLSSSSSS